ncbi:potassium-transporting ATPase subunit F [Salinicola endophyticus]|uniref:Potassium-transporting ATPase subunit F n=1 Tax=Salinicola endophyticus TaxID=1949083 RepID=A0ABY8FEC6_9GAMM|nr:potassium-transporting ATPase subunit F [Salinicola endophyticus]
MLGMSYLMLAIAAATALYLGVALWRPERF